MPGRQLNHEIGRFIGSRKDGSRSFEPQTDVLTL